MTLQARLVYLCVPMFQNVADGRWEFVIELIDELRPLPPGVLQDVVGQVHQRQLLVLVLRPRKVLLPGCNHLLCVLEAGQDTLKPHLAEKQFGGRKRRSCSSLVCNQDRRVTCSDTVSAGSDCSPCK